MAIAEGGYIRRVQEVPIDGISAELLPDYNFVALKPKPLGISPARLRMLWHDGSKPQGATLRIGADDGKSHKLRVRIESSDNRFRSSWVKWALPTRQARELQGGDALSAQDELLQSDQVLHLMLTAGETRVVTLEFIPVLDGTTTTGDYPFQVVIEDITGAGEGDGGVVRVNGTLCLTHPESNILQELPALYREALWDLRDDVAGYQDPPFFERFLLGFEDTIEPLQQTLNQLDRLFGPYSTPPDFVLWLGAWVAMPLDENWPEMRRRKLIKEAVNLYRWRGTKKGLARYIQIYTGYEPDIQDQPVDGMKLGPEAKLGSKEAVLGNVPSHTFVVTLSHPDPDKINEQTIHDIIRYEKPAHTAYALRIVRRGAGE